MLPVFGFILNAIRYLYALILPFFGQFFSRLAIFFAWLLPFAVEKVIKLLGFSVVSYAGVSVVVDKLSDFILSKLNGLPADMLQIFLIMKLDAGFKIMLTAMTIAIGLKLAFKSTTVVWKKPGSPWEA